MATTTSASIVNEIALLISLYHNAQRKRVEGEMTTEIIAKLQSRLAELGRSPEVGLALGSIAQIGRNLLQDQLERAQLNPCETMEPVRHIRESYGAIEQAIAEISDFARDSRFHWWSNPPWYPLEMRIPLTEISERTAALEGHLHGASQHANRATVTALRLRDPRTALGAQTTSLPATLQDTNSYLIRIPEAPYRSEHEAVRRIRILMLLFAIQLYEAVKRGRRRLERGAVDKAGEMVRPSTISAALADLNEVLWRSSLTCAALSRLATESQQK